MCLIVLVFTKALDSIVPGIVVFIKSFPVDNFLTLVELMIRCAVTIVFVYIAADDVAVTSILSIVRSILSCPL